MKTSKKSDNCSGAMSWTGKSKPASKNSHMPATNGGDLPGKGKKPMKKGK